MSIFQGGNTNYYAIFTVIGILASVFVLFLIIKKKHLYTDELIYGGIWIAVGAFLGAHVMFLLVNLPDLLSGLSSHPPLDVGDFFTRLYYAASGLVFYGGLLGGLFTLYLYTKRKYLNTRHFLNLFVVVFPLFHAIGRIGCVFSGCCYGVEYHGICAIHYPDSVIVEGINDHIIDYTRFPIQPMEAILEGIIFVILLLLYLKKGDSISITIPYLLMYAVVRFFDEFLRGDVYRGIWGPFSTAQWTALIIIAVTLLYVFSRRRTAAA